jgi:uncharacterized cysteine cluster protein YcgN (CxxCxxCC family)
LGKDKGLEQGLAHPSEAREAMCRRCGRCCYAKFLVGDQIIYTDTPCAHLDLDTRLCRIYEHRQAVNPDCLSVQQGVRRGVFPADCPYAVDVPDYKAPVEDTDPTLLAAAIDALKAEEVDS